MKFLIPSFPTLCGTCIVGLETSMNKSWTVAFPEVLASDLGKTSD